MRAKAAEELADEGDMAGAAIVEARNKFLTEVMANCPALISLRQYSRTFMLLLPVVLQNQWSVQSAG